MNEIKLSKFQDRVCLTPEKYDLFLGGGRGGSKSFTMAVLALRHCEQYREKARVLYIRQSYPGMRDFENLTREIFGSLYGTAASYHGTEHAWKLPNGGYIELGQLESPRDYAKYQGRSFTLLMVDECSQYATPELIDKLRSNLRGPRDMPIRIVMAANPGDVGHHWVAKRYVFKSAPWKPFKEENSGRTWVNAPSTYQNNPFIDQQTYKNQLEASCPSDPELLRAWLNGDWSVARGAFFASVIEESRNAIDPIEKIPNQYRKWGDEKRLWDHWLAHDYGSSAPSVTYLMLQSPGGELDGRYYPKDSIIIIDELATADPVALNQGLGYTIPHLSEYITEMCERWDIKPEGVADDAIFAQHGSSGGSIADEFKREGIYFRPAQKADRKSGWAIMRRMLQDAGKPDRPGLYIARNCEYFWSTVPYLGRDPRNAEDLDTRGPDHGADAVRYGLLRQAREPITAGMINF